MALKPNDVICRRIPLAFLDNKAADQLLPEIVEIMAAHKGWSETQAEQELQEAK